MKSDFKGSFENGLISEKQFRKLAEVHNKHCISIYIPTDRAGSDSEIKRGKLRLKNQIKNVKATLSNFNLKENEIEGLTEPLFSLLDNDRFWRHQSDGLAVLLDNDELYVYTLPVHFEEYSYVGDHFYLKPIIPFFNDDGKFYVLALSLKDVRLYECSRHFITDIYVKDLTPDQLEDAVGYDYRDKSLQYRTGKGGDAGAMFHGQGSGKDDKEEEIEKFFRAVDNGIMNLLNNEDAPLLLACVDHYYPIYKSISDYQYIYHKNISGNPDDVDSILLHEKAWLLVKDHFRQMRKNKRKQFQDLSATRKAAVELSDIITAAVDGRIDTLFIHEGKDVFGLYDEVNRKLEVDNSPEIYNSSLFNMATLHTIKNGGRVYLSPADEMPLKNSEINALLRY